jgi:hypothetical protein
VSSVQEPEWDDEQVDLVIAEQMVRNLTGPNGEWLPEATLPITTLMERRIRFVPSGEHVNLAEKARLDKLDEIRKSKGKDANLNGVYVTVERQEY